MTEETKEQVARRLYNKAWENGNFMDAFEEAYTAGAASKEAECEGLWRIVERYFKDGCRCEEIPKMGLCDTCKLAETALAAQPTGEKL